MGRPAPIEFVEQGDASDAGASENVLNDAAKAKSRAEKYGLPVTNTNASRSQPSLVRDETRKSAALKRADGITGFDIYDADEVARQKQRAARFGTAPPETEIAFAQPSADEEAKKARAAKFGMEYTEPDPSGVDNNLLMEERREMDPAGTPRPEALHVYGVDLVGTRDLLNFFSIYGPTYVEWIDDSSCNVLFPDEYTVKRLLVQLGEALSAEDVAKVDAIAATDAMVQRLWYRAKKPLMKEGVAVPLLFRVALTSDAKDYLKQHKTRRLWTMPVRQAVAVAQGKIEAPKPHKSKRDRVDNDGDAVMSGPGRQRKGGKKHKESNGVAEGKQSAKKHEHGPPSFLDDDRREDGAHSYFLNDEQQEALQADDAQLAVAQAGAVAEAGAADDNAEAVDAQEQRPSGEQPIVVDDDDDDAHVMEVE